MACRLLPGSALLVLCAPGSAAGGTVPGLPMGAAVSLLFARTRNPRLFRTFTLPQYIDVG